MADQTTVLQLVLDDLGVGNNINTQEDRVGIQKLICLTQEAGLQLGYSFNWYVRGPYSPALTSDYYQIASAKESVEADACKFVLSDAARNALAKVKSVMNVPEGVLLPTVQWLELVASIAFLTKSYRFNRQQAENKIRESKAGLYPYFAQGYNALQTAGFVG
jgi:uncharacterized protein YwgA